MDNIDLATIELQNGSVIPLHVWNPAEPVAQAIPLLLISPGSSSDDWHEFTRFISPTYKPILVGVGSSMDLLLYIWELGVPVALAAQGDEAAALISNLVSTAPAAAESIIICDGELSTTQIDGMHAIPTLILRGRQSTAISHESAVTMHNAIRHSTLIEPENCGDFPAKDNPDAAASAVNWFLVGSGSDFAESDDSEPIDPKA